MKSGTRIFEIDIWDASLAIELTAERSQIQEVFSHDSDRLLFMSSNFLSLRTKEPKVTSYNDVDTERYDNFRDSRISSKRRKLLLVRTQMWFVVPKRILLIAEGLLMEITFRKSVYCINIDIIFLFYIHDHS